MPRAIDFNRLTITHDPTQRQDLALPTFPPITIEQLLENWQKVLKQFTGIDLSGLDGGLKLFVEFIGGRKNKDSLYTKLLSKQDTIASQVYDKLRFRIVTRDRDDIFPVIQYLTKRLFPFNYVIPGQSINSIFHFKKFCQDHAHLKPMLPEMQAGKDEDYTSQAYPIWPCARVNIASSQH